MSGNAQICIICNISPLAKHIEESHLTLKFATRAKKIKQHARITEIADERTLLENYREEIEELKLQLKEAREGAHENIGTNTSIDDEDIEVLTQAVSNLERLILKTSTAEERRRKQKRREAMARMRQGTGIPQSISQETDVNSTDNANSLLNGVLNQGEDENTLLNSLSLDEFSSSNLGRKGMSSSNFKDDQSLGSGSLGDESTVLEGKKLVNELHRIQTLLGKVLEKKGSAVTPSKSSASYESLTPRRSQGSEEEVERLRAQLHEQAVHTSLRKADSTFLQSQLEQKDVLLKDISQILEAVEKRQVELEAENERLKREFTRSSEALRSKDAETAILEKLIKKRETEIKRLRAELGESS